MTTTPDLVDALSSNLKPAGRLRPPAARAGCWLLLAALVLALMSFSQGLRPDLPSRLEDPAFAFGMACSALTGIFAALAAFMASLPDRPRSWLLLPLLPLAGWMGSIGDQCLTHWVAFDHMGVSLGETARCLATLVLTSLPLSLAMAIMLRHAAVLSPMTVSLAGSLAVGAITATALMLFHPFDATAMILMWNVGSAILIVGLGGLLGRRMST